jgi:hypothetical protein
MFLKILWVSPIPLRNLWSVVGWDVIWWGGNRFYQGLFLMVTHIPQPLLHITMVFPIECNKYLIIYLNKTPKQITKLILSYALEFEVSLKWQIVLDYHSGYSIEKQQILGKNCIIASYNNNSIKSLVPQLPHLWYYYIPFICLLCDIYGSVEQERTGNNVIFICSHIFRQVYQVLLWIMSSFSYFNYCWFEVWTCHKGQCV